MSQAVKLVGGGHGMATRAALLPFLDHVHGLDAGDGQPAERHREHQHQNEPKPEAGNGVERQRADGERPVAEGAGAAAGAGASASFFPQADNANTDNARTRAFRFIPKFSIKTSRIRTKKVPAQRQVCEESILSRFAKKQ